MEKYDLQNMHQLDIVAAQSFYRENEFVIFQDFLPKSFVKQIESKISQAEVNQFKHTDGSRDLMILDKTIQFKLLQFLNSPSIRESIKLITGVNRNVKFNGRISVQDSSSEVNWHNDSFGGRVLGLSLRIGKQEYSGGELYLRNKNCEEIQIGYGINEAVVFKIHEENKHKVSKITEGNKISFVGWYSETDVKKN